MRDIDSLTKSLNRANEDVQAELEQEQNKILNELGGRLMAVIDKYAKDKGFALVLDVSSPQTPVLYATNDIDITKEIVDLYDKNAPVPLSAVPAKPGIIPASMPKPALPPAVLPPAKKTLAPK